MLLIVLDIWRHDCILTVTKWCIMRNWSRYQ